METRSATFPLYAARDGQQGGKHVIACVDGSEYAQKIVPHAFAVASALRVPLTLLQVLEVPMTSDFRPDPVELGIKRHEAKNALDRLAEVCADDLETIRVELTEGEAAERICRYAREQNAELTVLGTHSGHGHRMYGIGSTARAVLDQAAGSVLLVPISSESIQEPHYRRILLPLDGSPRSESALPLALRLAHAVDAELIIAHVVPTPELTQSGPLEAEDIELRERVIKRNERVARSYLSRIRNYVGAQRLEVRALTLRGDDVRSGLISLIGGECIDLVVLSARGHGGDRVCDLPYGNIVAYLTTHSPVPILIVHPTGSSNNLHVAPKHDVDRPPFKSVA